MVVFYLLVLTGHTDLYSTLHAYVTSNMITLEWDCCRLCRYSMAATVVQLYLKQVLESYFHTDLVVRRHAAEVAIIVLRQGLVQVATVSLRDFLKSWI